ncbi:MAG TPA: protein-export chaperone SecB [Desulfatiglandales bacterium]|nr:protein-export chaperone SecB [Desulfatiglandales bacterium]
MAEPKLKEHPINIETVVPRELSIKLNVDDPTLMEDIEKVTYSIAVGHSEYNHKEKAITVAIKLETEKAKNQTKKSPLSIRIELFAKFSVDEKRFPMKNIEDWATRNAPFILYPYLREHVYALTTRCGLKPLLLPLVEVPIFKIEKPKKPKASSAKPSKKD